MAWRDHTAPALEACHGFADGSLSDGLNHGGSADGFFVGGGAIILATLDMPGAVLFLELHFGVSQQAVNHAYENFLCPA